MNLSEPVRITKVFQRLKGYILRILPDSYLKVFQHFKAAVLKLRSRIKIGRSDKAFQNFCLSKLLFPNLEKRFFLKTADYLAICSGQILASENKLLHFSVPIFWNSTSGNKVCDDSRMSSKMLVSHDFILRNVIIIGESNLVLVGKDKVIYDLVNYDSKKKYRYTDFGIRGHNNFCCLVDKNPVSSVIEQGIKLSANYSWNYYHVVFEVMARFYKIEKLGIDSKIPLIIDEICLEIPQFKQLIELFNKDKRPIIPIRKGVKYLVNKLYFFSDLNIIPPNYEKKAVISPQDTLFDLDSLRYLRSKLLAKLAPGNYPDRIFLSRKNASSRRKYNEEEAFLVLEKFGFKKICPEAYSVLEQAAIFNQASHIVGVTGAAFSNLLFCKPTAKVLCITNYKLSVSIFSTIAHFVGLEFYYLAANEYFLFSSNDIHDDFTVDCFSLESYLNSKFPETFNDRKS